MKKKLILFYLFLPWQLQQQAAVHPYLPTV